jgi:uncharacterized protein (TIGR02058 family)
MLRSCIERRGLPIPGVFALAYGGVVMSFATINIPNTERNNALQTRHPLSRPGLLELHPRRWPRDDGARTRAYCRSSNRREPDMALKRMVLEIGMGTDIRGGDDTKAAVRALRDALWHNSLSVAAALGLDTDSMQVEVTIGTPHPEKVDKAQVLAVLPHGTGTVTVVQGGLEIPNDEGTNVTLLAQAAAVVWLDVA